MAIFYVSPKIKGRAVEHRQVYTSDGLLVGICVPNNYLCPNLNGEVWGKDKGGLDSLWKSCLECGQVTSEVPGDWIPPRLIRKPEKRHYFIGDIEISVLC